MTHFISSPHLFMSFIYINKYPTSVCETAVIEISDYLESIEKVGRENS